MAKLSGLNWLKDRIAWATTDEEARASPPADVLMRCGRCDHEEWLPADFYSAADQIEPRRGFSSHPCRLGPAREPKALAVRKVTVPLDPVTRAPYRMKAPETPDEAEAGRGGSSIGKPLLTHTSRPKLSRGQRLANTKRTLRNQ
jgi:hypothetical protein